MYLSLVKKYIYYLQKKISIVDCLGKEESFILLFLLSFDFLLLLLLFEGLEGIWLLLLEKIFNLSLFLSIFSILSIISFFLSLLFLFSFLAFSFSFLISSFLSLSLSSFFSFFYYFLFCFFWFFFFFFFFFWFIFIWSLFMPIFIF